MKWLDELREKPLAYRKRVVNITLVVTVVLLFLVWMGTGKAFSRREKDTRVLDTIKQGINDTKDKYKGSTNETR